MYTFIKNFKFHDGLLTDVPAFGISFLAAEFFYKFHSFALECGAFLVTWLVVSYLFASVLKLLSITQLGPSVEN